MKRTRISSLGLLLALIFVAQRPGAAQQGTASPHGALDEPCALCHSPSGWSPAHVSRDFDHGKWGWRLEGAHEQTSCRACHRTLDFRGTPADCISCHQDIHRGELGSDCSRCHTPRSFVDRSGMSRMHQLTQFPLTGAHLVADCTACHSGAAQGQFAFVGRSTECVSCHLERYLATTNPNHEAAGFPRECDQCHAVTMWNRARFNHNGSAFPLTGAHRSVPCQDCHTGGAYTGAPTTCVGCHQQDYDGTTNPAHGPAGFPTDCLACHNTTGWTGANFSHTQFFPLSGAHRGINCSSCHTNSSAYSEFTCLSCHEHNQTSMDSKHRGRSGYSYDSQACLRCHPSGRAD
ncbi:MAG: cytochrome c3 family protein [Gemmatimonadales bacterium]